jgi:hypothetical protein
LVTLPRQAKAWHGPAVKLLLAALLRWTAALVPLVLLVPGYVNTPGCAHKVGISAACAAQMAAENEDLFWQHTFPFLATVIGGYVLVAAVALVLVRRARVRAS